MMRRASAAILLFGSLATLLAGCGRGASTIPSGAQEVHVIVTGSDVRLDPAVAHAGDIYVVLDTPGSSVGYLERKTTAGETPGPLTDDDLVRIARGGDAGGFSISGFQAGGCSESQNAEDFGRTGYCGNVQQIVLSPGKYVFYTGTIEDGPPDSMAVLEVLP